MDKTDKITNLYNKLVLYNNELHNMYGNNIFSIDGISFYKPRCVAFIDRHSIVNYFITLRRCNTCHTIMKYINMVPLSNEVYLLSDDYYPQIGVNEVQGYFRHVVCNPLYKSGIFNEPAILYVGSHNIAYTYYCTTNNNCIKCGTLNISLSNNIFGDVQNESGCSYVFLYEPILDRFCAVSERPLDVTSLGDTPLDETSLDEYLISTIPIESFT